MRSITVEGRRPAPFARGIYQTLVKRSSVYTLGIFAGAFVFEMAFDSLGDYIWDNANKGVMSNNI